MQHSWYNSTLFYQQVKKNATSGIFEIGKTGNPLPWRGGRI
jgi:hypothetical protein